MKHSNYRSSITRFLRCRLYYHGISLPPTQGRRRACLIHSDALDTAYALVRFWEGVAGIVANGRAGGGRAGILDVFGAYQ